MVLLPKRLLRLFHNLQFEEGLFCLKEFVVGGVLYQKILFLWFVLLHDHYSCHYLDGHSVLQWLQQKRLYQQKEQKLLYCQYSAAGLVERASSEHRKEDRTDQYSPNIFLLVTPLVCPNLADIVHLHGVLFDFEIARFEYRAI